MTMEDSLAPVSADGLEFLGSEGLDILLVNDDGFDAEGIAILFDALTAAGHDVTLVAPQEQQSGQGTSISIEAIGQPTTVEEFAPGQFFVDATPITTVSAALDFILAGEVPDLVISGINEGPNVGESIAISSGTVSAATEATRRNLPGIAVSAATSDDLAEQTAIFELSAEVTVDLVEQLVMAQDGDADLLPEGVGLSVNIPAGIDAIAGVAITQLDETAPFEIFVGDLGAGTGGEANGVPSLLASVTPPITPEEITIPESEGQNFLANFTTITPVDGDFTASDATRQALEERVAAAPADAVATPLNILVTNDDGFDAEGITVLSEALAAAGHNITVVAPLEQQSGTGTALDVDLFFQPLEIVEQDISEEFDFEAFSVAAGVRTTTFAGLDFVLAGEAPDLVISGINSGENIGPGGAVSSGTVSAAVTALLRDVPAIAVSGGLDLTTFETPTETFEIGAEFIVDLIAQFQATQGDDASILPEGTGVSVNIPTRFPEGVEEIQGVAFTNASDTTPFEIEFGLLDPENPDAGAGLNFAPVAPPADPDSLSEGDQFLNGFITVTPIDGDFTADASGQEQAAALLNAPALDTDTVTGSSGADSILGGIDTDSVGDTILAGAGDDEIILALAGAGAGGNTVLAGSGADTIFASTDDTILGGAGNDTFIVEGTGNSLLGGAGDDTFILTGSDNIVTGGAGADLFVIAAPGDFPAVANAIADFDPAADLLAGVSFAEVTFAGSDVLVDGNTIATLIGVDAASLTAASFA